MRRHPGRDRLDPLGQVWARGERDQVPVLLPGHQPHERQGGRFSQCEGGLAESWEAGLSSGAGPGNVTPVAAVPVHQLSQLILRGKTRFFKMEVVRALCHRAAACPSSSIGGKFAP